MELDRIRTQYELNMESVDGISSGTSRKLRPVPVEPRSQRIEALMRQLFNLQDVNADGVIEEADLVRLNDRIARLLHGKGAPATAFMTTGRALFRERLDAFGRPVPYATFRKYVLQILQELDPKEVAQDLILEQFVAEANLVRGGNAGVGMFRYRTSGGVHIAQAPYMPVAPRRISFMPVAPCRMGLSLSRDPRMQQQMVTL